MLFILLIDIIIWLLIAKFIAENKKDNFHIGVIFSLLFIITYPLKFIASLFGYYVMDVSSLDLIWWYQSIIFFNLSGLMCILPLLTMKKYGFSNMLNTQRHVETKPNGWLLFISIMMIVFSYGTGAIVALISFSADILQSRIDERSDERMNSGIMAVFRDVGLSLLIYCLMQLSSVWMSLKNIKKVFWLSIIAFLCIILLTVSGSKYQGLLPIFSFALSLHYYRRRMGVKQGNFLKVILYSVVSLFFVGLFGYIRGFGGIEDQYGVGEVELGFQQLSNAFDGPDNLTFILSRMDDIWFGDLSFLPTKDYLLGWFPRVLWPDKPVIMGNLRIMSIYMPERFMGGTGEVISPSMPGEMIISGGIFFMLAWSFFLGFLCAKVYKYAYIGMGWWVNVIYIWTISNIFNLLRSGTGIIGALIIFSFGVAISSILISYSRKLKYS